MLEFWWIYTLQHNFESVFEAQTELFDQVFELLLSISINYPGIIF
jgi:hypothetical protein